MDYFGGKQFTEKKVAKIQGPLSPQALFELFLFSVMMFLAAAFVMQFLLTFQQAIMLKMLSIEYQYHPLGIGFSFASEIKWNDSRVFGVYGLVPLLFFVIGVVLVRFLMYTSTLHWKWRLFLTWMSFFLVHSLPIGLIAGVFLYDGYGYAFGWLVDSVGIRLLVGLGLVLLVRYYRFFWLSLFLKSAYSSSLISEYTSRKAFIVNTVYRPWFVGLVALLPLVFAVRSLYWGAFLICLGLVFLPLFGRDFPDTKLTINPSEKPIWPLKYPFAYLVFAWALLWLTMQFVF